VDVTWKELPNGFTVELGEGALTLLVVNDGDGWRSCINDRVVKFTYPTADAAKQATISWARQKLKMIEGELFALEHPWKTPEGGRK
jgi:hypothetical protein